MGCLTHLLEVSTVQDTAARGLFCFDRVSSLRFESVLGFLLF